jgi:hypothetical protein
MATPRTFPEPVRQPARAHTTTVERKGVASRWRAHRAERKQSRLISARSRRVLARWLRRTANRTIGPHPFARRRESLLAYRVAAVRTELLEIAALIEHTRSPDPGRVATIRDLLANGCASPLYNPDIHISELHATLHYIRSGL